MDERQYAISGAITATSHLNGEIWECGTFRGEGAALIKSYLPDGVVLRCFDSFTGLPFSCDLDKHPAGAMNETSYDTVADLFKDSEDVFIHSGIMPYTFSALENCQVRVVNIDVDNYQSVKDCLEWIYPHVVGGGYIFIDDYNCPNCPGAKIATQEFLKDKPEMNFLSGRGDTNPQAYFVKI